MSSVGASSNARTAKPCRSKLPSPAWPAYSPARWPSCRRSLSSRLLRPERLLKSPILISPCLESPRTGQVTQDVRPVIPLGRRVTTRRVRPPAEQVPGLGHRRRFLRVPGRARALPPLRRAGLSLVAPRGDRARAQGAAGRDRRLLPAPLPRRARLGLRQPRVRRRPARLGVPVRGL